MDNKEIYKDIKGYEGKYQITNSGRVYSLITKRFLKPNHHKCGYVKIALSDNGTIRTFLVHRLVAYNFIDNPNKYPDINHKDGNKINNNASNLEWVTKSEKTRHASKNNISNFRKNILSNLEKIDQKTNYKKVILKKRSNIYEFTSVGQAADFFGLKRDNITRAIRKGQKVGGFEVFGYRIANEENL